MRLASLVRGSRGTAALEAWAERWSSVLQPGWGGDANARFPGRGYWDELHAGAGAQEWGGGHGLSRLAARLHRARGGTPSPRALHLGCGTSGLGAALAARGWQVTNADFSEPAVALLAELDSLGLLAPVPRGRVASDFAVCDALAPPACWEAAFEVVVEKGLVDTLLFGGQASEALGRAAAYARAVEQVLRPGGCFLQLSDAPVVLRRELFETIWGSEWVFEERRVGAPSL